MTIEGKKIGVGITGSFCTYAYIFDKLEKLVESGAYVQTIFSSSAGQIDSRFGKAEEFIKKAEKITKNKPWFKIQEVEPIGPKNYFDLMILLPCTGNTLAKLANGITDTSVLMAAKAHLRNQKPLLISVSTNDGLAMNMKNIGLLLNCKNIYFIPFKQDDPFKKPNSLMANLDDLIPSVENALDGKQYQPVLAR